MQHKKPPKLPTSTLLFSSMINNSTCLNQHYVKQQQRLSALHVEILLDGERVHQRRPKKNGTACLIGMYHHTENCSAVWYRPRAANRYPSLATRLCFWSKEDHNSICTVAVMYWVGVVYRTVRTMKLKSSHGFIIENSSCFFCRCLFYFILYFSFSFCFLSAFFGLSLVWFLLFECLHWMKIFKFLMCSVNYLRTYFPFSLSFLLLDAKQNPKSKIPWNVALRVCVYDISA